jgi:hypothetical protein
LVILYSAQGGMPENITVLYIPVAPSIHPP